jgi:putative PIN family toxin of toxin-antitoxin system
MKVVLDTNVLLSGLMYPDSTPGRIVRDWREARFELALSFEQLGEIARALSYPKIQKILAWDAEQIERFLKQLYLRAEVLDITAIEAEVPADPDDAPILAGFIGAKADYLVTGHSDLLALRGKFSILTSSEFAQRLET